MKHLQTYYQLNESINTSNFMKKILENFDDKIDKSKLTKIVMRFKNDLYRLFTKYSENSKINADRIFKDVKSFNLTTESYWDPEYDEDQSNNVILRMLYKFFIKWPKNVVKFIWEMFYDTVIETWKWGSALDRIMSGLMLACWIIVGIVVYFLIYLSVMFIDMKFNGIEHGKVTDKVFQAEHNELVPVTIMVGKVPVTTYHTVHYNDRWFVQVTNGDRVEDWVTYNRDLADTTSIGKEIDKIEDWSWSSTEKR